MSHPVQDIERGMDGVLRFRSNLLVEWLFNTAGVTMRDIVPLVGTAPLAHVSLAPHYARVVEVADFEQLLQLVGLPVEHLLDQQSVSDVGKAAVRIAADDFEQQSSRSQ